MPQPYQGSTRTATQNGTAPTTQSTVDLVDLAHVRQLFAILPAMLFTSRSDGVWDYVNPSFCAYTGCAEETLTGLGWADILHIDDRGPSLLRWRSTIRSEAAFHVEHRLRGATGSYRWVCTRCVPLRNMAGSVILWAGIAILLAENEHHTAHERTLLCSAALARNERDRVLASVTHKLRTPLTILLGQTHLLHHWSCARAGTNPNDRHADDQVVVQTLGFKELVTALLEMTVA
ncbi:MAG: PAS domain-containing protein [Chloroflexales bacterium]